MTSKIKKKTILNSYASECKSTRSQQSFLIILCMIQNNKRSSLFLDWGNQEKLIVLQSVNGTNLQFWQNDRGRNAPVRVQHASTIIPKQHW